MRDQYDSSESQELVFQWLQNHNDRQLDLTTLDALAHAITPYVRRSRLPLEMAVQRITHNYLNDGKRVHELLSDPSSPEWTKILDMVISVAKKQRQFPNDAEAQSWPDLDAYNDIRHNLRNFNFEGTLDTWINVMVVRRIGRFWRDQQSLRQGGGGFLSAEQRKQDQASGRESASPRVKHFSLDILVDGNQSIADRLKDDRESVEEMVELAEFHRLVTQIVQKYADDKNDPMICDIWSAVVERQEKLHEVATRFGISISLVHRRIEQVRTHLRQDPRVRQWHDRDNEAQAHAREP